MPYEEEFQLKCSLNFSLPYGPCLRDGWSGLEALGDPGDGAGDGGGEDDRGAAEGGGSSCAH